MNYKEWLETNFFEQDMRMVSAEMAFNEAQKLEREACANICEERAKKCSIQANTTNDKDDRTELESLVWQFSVLGDEIRKRSNK